MWMLLCCNAGNLPGKAMRYLLIVAALFVAGFVLWRGLPGLPQHSPSGVAANGPMTAKKLVELSRSDPAAFDAYVRAHINDVPPKPTGDTSSASRVAPISLEEFVKAGRSDPQAIAELLASRGEVQEPTTIDKLLNFLTHGKYE